MIRVETSGRKHQRVRISRTSTPVSKERWSRSLCRWMFSWRCYSSSIWRSRSASCLCARSVSLSPQALSVTAASVGKRMVVMVFMVVSGVGLVVLIAVSRATGLSSAALPDGNEREGRRRRKYQTHPTLYSERSDKSPLEIGKRLILFSL